MKKINILFTLFIFVILGLAFSASRPVYSASKNYKTVLAAKATPSPTPTPTPQEVNSFDIFWPLTAGRTADEPFYFLKELKETLRGFLIFGLPQKLDYSVLLATKRVLEAEKLLNESKSDTAKSTLNRAMDQLNKADKFVNDAKSSNQSLGDVSQQVSSRLTNIAKLTTWLATKGGNSSAKDLLIQVADKATSIASKF